MGVIRKEVSTRFQRRHMKNMKYLAASHTPSGTAMLLIIFLECLAVAGVIVGYARTKRYSYGYRGRYY
jgi:hypothetical protein